MVITMNKIRQISSNKYLCIGFFICAFIFGLVLPFCWGNNPAEPTGTLSLLCEHHQGWFWLWTVLTGGCFFFNIHHMFVKFNYRNRLLDAFTVLMLLGMILIAATLNHDISNWNPKRVAHWAGAVLYAFFTIGSVLLFFVLNIKRKGFLPFAIIMIMMPFIVLGWLILIGKSGYMEIIPNAFMEALLFSVNFLGILKPEKEKIKA